MLIPGMLNETSILPCLSMTCLTAPCTLSRSVTSSLTFKTSPPIHSPAVVSIPSSSTSASITLAPRESNPSAMALPSPEAAPVTRVTLSSTLNMSCGRYIHLSIVQSLSLSVMSTPPGEVIAEVREPDQSQYLGSGSGPASSRPGCLALEEPPGVLDHDRLDLVVGHTRLLQLRDDVLEDVGRVPVAHELLGKHDVPAGPVEHHIMGEYQLVGITHRDEAHDGTDAELVGAGLPEVGVQAEPVEREEDSLVKYLAVVFEVRGSPCVPYGELLRAGARLDQDIDLLGTHRSRLGVGDDRDPCVLLGAARGLQYALLEIGYDILAGRDLDDARLYPRVTYALGELGHEDILHHVDHVLEPAAELEVRGAALAFGVEPRSAYDLDSRSLGQLLQELGVPARIVRRRVYVSLDPLGLDIVQGLEGDLARLLFVVFLARVRVPACIVVLYVLVHEGDSELFRGDRASHRVNRLCHLLVLLASNRRYLSLHRCPFHGLSAFEPPPAQGRVVRQRLSPA